MTLTEATQRIKDGLGFFTGTNRDATILLRLQEAQRDLEKGKTLPEFLLVEDFTDVLASGDHTIPVPTDFLYMKEEERPHYYISTSDQPVFLTRIMSYFDAVTANLNTDTSTTATAPTVYVQRTETFDFITEADAAYTIYFSYYGAADVLGGSVTTNAWLANAPEWLIGEAGLRIAMDTRNKGGVEIFTSMMTKARAAIFTAKITNEEADGPFIMGRDL